MELAVHMKKIDREVGMDRTLAPDRGVHNRGIKRQEILLFEENAGLDVQRGESDLPGRRGGDGGYRARSAASDC